MPTVDSRLTFFHLPQAIRNEIYSYAFGHIQRSFRYQGSTFTTYGNGPVLGPGIIHGLPTWILTNRLICQEAIELLLYSQYLSPWRPSWRYRMQVLEARVQGLMRPAAPIDSVTQSLLLHEASVKKIALGFLVREEDNAVQYNHERSYHNYFCCSPQKFLEMIEPFLGTGPHLTMEWNNKYVLYIGRRYTGTPEVFSTWSESWVGRFRTVEITFLSSQLDSFMWKEHAEVVAKKLVGDGSTTTRTAWREERLKEPCQPIPPCVADGVGCPRMESLDIERRLGQDDVWRYWLRATS